MRYVIPLAVAALVVGCVTPQERSANYMSDAHSTCLAAGYQEGTPEFSNCSLTLYQQSQANHEAARARAMAAGIEMMRQQSAPPPPPHVVVCQMNGNQVVCL